MLLLVLHDWRLLYMLLIFRLLLSMRCRFYTNRPPALRHLSRPSWLFSHTYLLYLIFLWFVLSFIETLCCASIALPHISSFSSVTCDGWTSVGWYRRKEGTFKARVIDARNRQVLQHNATISLFQGSLFLRTVNSHIMSIKM